MDITGIEEIQGIGFLKRSPAKKAAAQQRKEVRQEKRQERKATQQANRQERKAIRQENKAIRQEVRATPKAQRPAARQEARQQIKENRQQVKQLRKEMPRTTAGKVVRKAAPIVAGAALAVAVPKLAPVIGKKLIAGAGKKAVVKAAGKTAARTAQTAGKTAARAARKAATETVKRAGRKAATDAGKTQVNKALDRVRKKREDRKKPVVIETTPTKAKILDLQDAGNSNTQIQEQLQQHIENTTAATPAQAEQAAATLVAEATAEKATALIENRVQELAEAGAPPEAITQELTQHLEETTAASPEQAAATAETLVSDALDLEQEQPEEQEFFEEEEQEFFDENQDEAMQLEGIYTDFGRVRGATGRKAANNKKGSKTTAQTRKTAPQKKTTKAPTRAGKVIRQVSTAVKERLNIPSRNNAMQTVDVTAREIESTMPTTITPPIVTPSTGQEKRFISKIPNTVVGAVLGAAATYLLLKK